MPELIWPSPITFVSDSFDNHRNRTPASTNPGTDIGCASGTDVYAIADGVVSANGVDNNINSAAGRNLTILTDNGYTSQQLHLSKILVRNGERVKQGQVVALSGGSGFGSERGYGPHLHQTLRISGRNVDFENYVVRGSTASTTTKPFDPVILRKGKMLFVIRFKNTGACYLWDKTQPDKKHATYIQTTVDLARLTSLFGLVEFDAQSEWEIIRQRYNLGN